MLSPALMESSFIPSRERLERALELARLAPSAHNTQPWRVRVEATVITVVGDEDRALKVTDPSRRDFLLSLGSFTRALEVGLAEEGLAFRLKKDDPNAFARFEIVGELPPGDPRATLLRQRVTSRLKYSPRALNADTLGLLEQKARSLGLDVKWFHQSSDERQKLEAWFAAAAREGWLHVPGVDELGAWLRYDPEGLLAPDDGLSTRTLGVSALEEVGLMAASQGGVWSALSKVFAAPLLANTLADAEKKTVGHAPTWGVLWAGGEARDCGGALLDFWLEATRLRCSLQPLSVLLDRRGWELAKSLSIRPEQLVGVFRIGRSVPAPRSGRRPASAFVTWA